MEMPQPTVVIHDASRQTWFNFRDPIAIHVAHSPEEVLPVLHQIQQQVEMRQLYAAGFVSYEAAPAFDPVFRVKPTTFPLAWFGLYAQPEALVLSKSCTSPTLSWVPRISQKQYHSAFDQIKAYIRQGLTYQVNYSLRLQTDFQQSAWQYFNSLGQQGRYGAFLETEDWAICCASPELFFRQEGRQVQCRPMKGTVARGLNSEGDRRLAQWLQNSVKNQAENVMIVDMIRNDLGRIAQLGTVEVASLFDLEQYPTLWQMTSSVQCQTDAGLGEIFRALFPCASITGAPKARTTQIIAELEDTPRKIYTGAIGFITPQRTAQFNVAIRTVLIDKIRQAAEYGVGGGIVWDSVAGDEYAECSTKAKILTVQHPEFSLLETLLWTPEGGYFLLDLHVERLMASARYFDFSVDETRVREELAALIQACSHAQKVRLLLARRGNLTCTKIFLGQHGGVTPTSITGDGTGGAAVLRVCLAAYPVDSTNVFLYHKTTHRDLYDQARRQCPDYDDVLLWNEKGELTESCIANLVVERDGLLYTPPVSCGLLAGTFRGWLLAQGLVQERVIRVTELADCSRIFLVNSVRQKQEARLGI